jgi:hypothetical protein
LLGGRESVGTPLAAGATVEVGIASAMSIPEDVAAGEYYLLAVVDETRLVAESDEGNNVASNLIAIGIPHEYELTITVYDNFVDKTPIPGLLVFANDPADGTVIDETFTDEYGYAELVTQGLERVTLGFAFELQAGTSIFRMIQTMFSIPLGDWTTYLEYGYESYEWVGRMNVEITQLPPSYEYTVIMPMHDWRDSSFGGVHQNVYIYSDYLQDDGTISILAAAGDEAVNPIKYGYLLDQQFQDGGTYEVPLQDALKPGLFSFLSSRPIHDIEVNAHRKGVVFNLGTMFDYTLPFIEGSFYVLDQFPLSPSPDDTYVIDVSFVEELGDDLRVFNYQKDYPTVPPSTLINIPDYMLNAVSLNPAGRSVSWSVTGDPSAVDVTLTELYSEYTNESTSIEVMWLLITDRAYHGIIAPELPSSIIGWFDFGAISEVGGHYFMNDGELFIRVEGTEFDEMDGFDELIQYIQSHDIEPPFSPYFVATYYKPYPYEYE